MAKGLQSNIWKYTLILVTNKRIFVAILGTYYLTIPEVTPQWIGTILLISTLVGFLFEIPSGYFADKIGHKLTITIAKVFLIFSSLSLLCATNVYLLILGGIFLSLGTAFHSGTGTAFMHETLRALGREGDYSRVMGKAGSLGFAIPIVLTALVPFLIGINYKLPFVVGLILDCIGLCAAFILVKPPITPEHVEEIGLTNFREVLREGYRLQYFRHALFSGVISGFLFAVGIFRAPYQSVLDLPVIWFGIFFGAGRVLASLLLAYSGKLHGCFFDIYQYQAFRLILFATLLLLLGLVVSPWIVVALFLMINGFQWGLSQVGTSFLLEIIKGSKFKATLLSVPTQIDMAISAITSFTLGWTIERFSYQSGFLFIALLFVVILLPFYFYLLASKPRLAESG